MITSLRRSIHEHLQKNAFCIEDQYYTYQQLFVRIRAIQASIMQWQPGKSVPVGIVTTNTIDTYASILACWFSGNYYVPLNPKLPAERNQTIVQEAQIELILTAEKDSHNLFLNENDNHFVHTCSLNDSTDNHIEEVQLTDKSLLYILFTSGSTGIPKGVPITYGNIKAFLDSYFALGFDCNAGDRFLQMFDLTFDVSIASYLVPLLLGACIYTLPSEGIKYKHVYNILKNYKITFATIVPSILNYLSPYFNEIRLPDLKYCILTAEASNINLVKKWSDSMFNGKIINLYGPTEATIWCTGYFFDPLHEKSYNEMLVIGRPFKNVKAVILDPEQNEVNDGEKGELCISSSQITPGYINNEEKNNEVFFVKDGIRFYKTGDLCYTDKAGDFFYCGRIDHQVKVQGFRIELSEIEVMVRKLFQIDNIAVAYKNALGVVQICVFVENYGITNLEEIKNELGKHLPYYMIPSQIKYIDIFPYNTSGKIDRVALANLL